MEYSKYVLSAGLEFFFAYISIILIIGCCLDHDHKRKTNQLMIIILLINTVMNIDDACVWIWCDVTSVQILMKILSFLSYTFGCMIMSLFSMLLISIIKEYTMVKKWINYVFYGITILMILFWLLSLINNMYYYWDENGICQNGDFYWLSQSFGIFIFLFDICIVLYYRKALRKRDTIVLILYNLIPLSSFLFIAFWDVTPLYMAITTVLLLYYIIIHVEHGQRIAEQETLLVKQELELTNKRTSIVLSQIRPHFLYNSLSAIAQLCVKNPQKAKEITISFSEYLRQNMNSLDLKSTISFKKELEHVKNYLAIEEVRFGDALKIKYEIACMDFYLPALTLQPLVENAVKHGVGMKEDGGTVNISAKENNDFYEIIVEDNGIGYEQEKIIKDGKTHKGIQLVEIRLREMVNGTLKIESELGKGTLVTVSIPKNKL